MQPIRKAHFLFFVEFRLSTLGRPHPENAKKRNFALNVQKVPDA